MRSVAQIVVTLKARDPVAMTAAHAIREKMGVRSLERITVSDLWEISFELDDALRLQELARMLVERSIVFVNPNKHNYSIRIAKDEPLAGSVGEDGEPVYVVSYLRGRAEDPILADRVRRRFGLKGLTHIKRGRLWVLTFESSEMQGAEEIAREIAETESRHKGLLVNPHAEEYRVLAGELPVGIIE